jgi:ribosome recycling factor
LKDVVHQATKEVQSLHDRYLEEVDKIVKAKEKEIVSS